MSHQNLLEIIKNLIKSAVLKDEESLYLLLKGGPDAYQDLVQIIASKNSEYYVSSIGSLIYDSNGSFEAVTHLKIKWDDLTHSADSWIFKN